MTCSSTVPALETIYRGDSRRITVTITNNLGVPVNLTGKDVVLTCARYKQATPVFSITNTVHSDPTNGITIFDITQAYSLLAEVGQHMVDIVVYTDGGSTSTAFLGTVYFDNRVSVPV